MPEDKGGARSKKETATEKSPSPDTAEVASSAAVTPEPPSDQEIEDEEEPEMGGSPEFPEDLDPLDEDLSGPQAGNLLLADDRAAVGGNSGNLVVLPQEATSAAGHAAASSSAPSAAGHSGLGRHVRRVLNVDVMLRDQTGAIGRLDISNAPAAQVDVRNRPSVSGGHARVPAVNVGPSVDVNVPGAAAGQDRIPQESEFYAAGPSEGRHGNDQEMVTPPRRRRLPKVMDLVCERCGEKYVGLKVPPRPPLDAPPVAPPVVREQQPSGNEPVMAAGAHSDSGSSSSRASSPALCSNCLAYGPPRTYSNQSLPSEGSLASVLDLVRAPNVTVDARHQHELPDYSTERIPSAPPPVMTPVSPQLRSASTGAYDPFSPNRREADSLRYSYALPGPSPTNRQFARASGSAQTSRVVSPSPGPSGIRLASPSPGPSGLHLTSPGRRSSDIELALQAANPGLFVSPPPAVSPGTRHSPRVASPRENVAWQPSGGPTSQLLQSDRRLDIFSPRPGARNEPTMLSSSREERVCLEAFIASASVEPDQAEVPSPQIPLPGNVSGMAVMPPPPGPPIDSFWATSAEGGSLLASLGSPERRTFSPTHGSGGRRQRASDGSGGSGGSAVRAGVLSPGRVTPYGANPSPRRRYLTGDGEAAEENVPLVPGVYSQNTDPSGSRPSSRERGAGPR